MRGSSGAVITVHGTHVVKQGSVRVGEQGRWLRDHPATSLPAVFGVSADRYMMERLVCLDLELLHPMAVTQRVVELLERDVWSKPAEVKFDVPAHLDRLAPLLDNVAPLAGDFVGKWISSMMASIEWSELETCLTHGDPINDNLMSRSTPDGRVELVIIDPIPATPALPDVKALDIGRLLQSAAGYEKDRYELDIPNYFRSIASYLTEGQSNESRAAWYFAVVHTLRSLMYVDDETQKRIIGGTLARLINQYEERKYFT